MPYWPIICNSMIHVKKLFLAEAGFFKIYIYNFVKIRINYLKEGGSIQEQTLSIAMRPR